MKITTDTIRLEMVISLTEEEEKILDASKDLQMKVAWEAREAERSGYKTVVLSKSPGNFEFLVAPSKKTGQQDPK